MISFKAVINPQSSVFDIYMEPLQFTSDEHKLCNIICDVTFQNCFIMYFIDKYMYVYIYIYTCVCVYIYVVC